MSKKVLVISASPRKGGNSDILCDRFILGAQEAGHTTEKIFVGDYTVNFCMACYACRKTKKCIQKDSGNEILGKMVHADVIAFATPVYFYAMNGQMKTLIDRTLPLYSELKGKAYLIATCADPDINAVEGTVSGFRNFLRMTPELKESGMVFGLGTWDKGDVIGNPAFTEAYETGRNS